MAVKTHDLNSCEIKARIKFQAWTWFTCILHHVRVYYALSVWPVPSWLDSSSGKALHRYRYSHSRYWTGNSLKWRLTHLNEIFCHLYLVRLSTLASVASYSSSLMTRIWNGQFVVSYTEEHLASYHWSHRATTHSSEEREITFLSGSM